ncbi:MAG: RNase P subunit p30 family protein [archaeon]
MFIDVAIPSGDEKEFIQASKKLGTSGIIFVYEKDDRNNLEEVKKLNSKNFKVLTAIVGKMSSKYDYAFSMGERKDFENKKTDVIFNLEKNSGRDKPHYRSSGLNQVLCKLAKEKNILIALNFNSVLKAKDRELMMGRMAQNIKICKKYKVELLIASFAKKPSELRYWSDLISFGIVLGLNSKQAKKAVLNRKV